MLCYAMVSVCLHYAACADVYRSALYVDTSDSLNSVRQIIGLTRAIVIVIVIVTRLVTQVKVIHNCEDFFKIHLTSVSARRRLYGRRAQIKVHTDERTQVHSARSS